MDQSEADAAWQPFLDFLTSSPQDFVISEALKITAIPARHYWDPEYRKRVLPHTVVADNRLAGAPEDRVAAARDTATNPAVLDAFALALIAGGDPHTSPGLLGHEPDLAAGRKAAVPLPPPQMSCVRSRRSQEPMSRRAISLTTLGRRRFGEPTPNL